MWENISKYTFWLLLQTVCTYVILTKFSIHKCSLSTVVKPKAPSRNYSQLMVQNVKTETAVCLIHLNWSPRTVTLIKVFHKTKKRQFRAWTPKVQLYTVNSHSGILNVLIIRVPYIL